MPVADLSDPTPEFERLLSKAQAGDILFTGNGTIFTDLAEVMSDQDPRFGHVGVLLGVPGEWYMIDAGGPIPGLHDGVSAHPLQTFLGKTKRLGLFRPDLTAEERAVFLAATEKAAADNLPFDRKWDLETEDAVYCTELIWRALSLALGKDSVPSRTEISGLSVITLGDLAASPYLEEIETVSWR